LDCGEKGFQFYVRKRFENLSWRLLGAGVDGAEDAEAAPALTVPVRVSPAGAVTLLEVHNLALLAADPRILARGVG